MHLPGRSATGRRRVPTGTVTRSAAPSHARLCPFPAWPPSWCIPASVSRRRSGQSPLQAVQPHRSSGVLSRYGHGRGIAAGEACGKQTRPGGPARVRPTDRRARPAGIRCAQQERRASAPLSARPRGR